MQRPKKNIRRYVTDTRRKKNSLMKKAIKMPDEKHIEHIEEQRTKFVTF